MSYNWMTMCQEGLIFILGGQRSRERTGAASADKRRVDGRNEPPCVRHATYPRNNKLIDSCERPAVSNESERERMSEGESFVGSGAALGGGEVVIVVLSA